ncbi:hypothetical protein ABLN67_07070 [Mycobacterium tuberculosis]
MFNRFIYRRNGFSAFIIETLSRFSCATSLACSIATARCGSCTWWRG